MNKNALVFSIALEGYDKLFKPCIQSQKDYCERYGYEYLLFNESPRSLYPEEASWLKIPLIIMALQSDYEWVCFVDADCEIRTHTPCYRDYFGSYGEKSVFMSKGFSGRVNAGVIIAKSDSMALQLFDNILAHADDIMPEDSQALYENGHVIHYTKDNPVVEIIEGNKWNNNANLDIDSYIQHYSGGYLRSWYMDNLASSKSSRQGLRKSSLRLDKILKNITLNRLRTRLLKNRSYSHPKESISSSLKEIIPFYQNRYFRV